VQEPRRAELPIVADLRAVGVDVHSVWELVNTSVPYPAALAVLLKHVQLAGYPDRVMESPGRALAVEPAAYA
jgi:Flp pilus assembly protein TadB